MQLSVFYVRHVVYVPVCVLLWFLPPSARRSPVTHFAQQGLAWNAT